MTPEEHRQFLQRFGLTEKEAEIQRTDNLPPSTNFWQVSGGIPRELFFFYLPKYLERKIDVTKQLHEACTGEEPPRRRMMQHVQFWGEKYPEKALQARHNDFALYLDFILEVIPSSQQVIENIERVAQHSPVPFFATQTTRFPEHIIQDSRYAIQNPFKTDSIRVERYHVAGAGACSDAEKMYFTSVFSPESRSATVLLVDNIPVLVQKHEEEPSALALRTVRRSDGTYPLVKGGIYAIQNDIRFLYPFEHRRSFDFVHVRGDLAIQPLRFLGKKNTQINQTNNLAQTICSLVGVPYQ